MLYKHDIIMVYWNQHWNSWKTFDKRGLNFMELRVLQYFLAVTREQSISGAAKSLHLSQPTLSRQLKDMEDELGKQLFIRSNRKITLTEEGMLLRKRAEEIMELVRRKMKFPYQMKPLPATSPSEPENPTASAFWPRRREPSKKNIRWFIFTSSAAIRPP